MEPVPQQEAGLQGLKKFLEDPEESSSSSPEEVEVPAASDLGASGLGSLLERAERERSSSGEEWEKVRRRRVL